LYNTTSFCSKSLHVLRNHYTQVQSLQVTPKRRSDFFLAALNVVFPKSWWHVDAHPHCDLLIGRVGLCALPPFNAHDCHTPQFSMFLYTSATFIRLFCLRYTHTCSPTRGSLRLAFVDKYLPISHDFSKCRSRQCLGCSCSPLSWSVIRARKRSPLAADEPHSRGKAPN
jgi:hypothetical protein